jgi:hypothetical protein
MPKLDKQDQRIADIFGTKDVPDVTDETLETYLDYLKQHLEIPCQVTGIEDMGCFAWEEYYTFGPGSERQYEKLKKKRASYTDTFELLSFDDDYDEDYGLVVNVRRLSDKKKFVLTLSDLKATDKKSKNYELLDDFSVWFVNWR